MGPAVTNSDRNNHLVDESHLRLCSSPYPGHGWPIQLSDGLIHLQVISPDFRAHGVHQWESKQDNVSLFHRFTWEKELVRPRMPAGSKWKTDCLFIHTLNKPDSHRIINLEQQRPHQQGEGSGAAGRITPCCLAKGRAEQQLMVCPWCHVCWKLCQGRTLAQP